MMHGCRKLMLMLEDVDEDEDEDVSSRLLAVSNVPRYGDYYVLPDQRYPKPGQEASSKQSHLHI